MNDKPKYMRNTPPFVRYVAAAIPMVFDDSLSYYEALCALWKYIQGMTDVINANAALEQDFINRFNNLSGKFDELKSYIDHYFDNLDVQEEINNKLDEMVEDGTLETIISKYINYPLGSLLFKKLNSFEFLESDKYEGYDHGSLQGFCFVNGKLVCALRSRFAYDNYVRLVEIDYVNNRIVREAYLELFHANSLSFRKDTGKIYVSACNRAVDGSVVPDDRIFIVDYDSFTIDQTINVSNLPEGHRIRSVWYDNENSVLYAGDVTTMFVINDEWEIVETIDLETTGLDTSATNQTLKYVNNFYIGLFISFIAVWRKDGSLLRVIDIDTVQPSGYIGEVEDIAFDNNNNVILGTSTRPSPRLGNNYANFLISNLSKNTNQIENLWGADTTVANIYVDANSNKTQELGTYTYPFKKLQDAVNFAKYIPRYTKINIAEGNYSHCYITGISYLEFVIWNDGNVVIDGIETVNSNLKIMPSNGNLTIKGILINNSDLTITEQNSLTLEPNNHSNFAGYRRCVLCYGGHIDIRSGNFVGDQNSTNLFHATDNCISSLNNCTFSNYNGNYAIVGNNNAVIYTYNNTYSKAVSDTEHTVKIERGARFYRKNDMENPQHFTIDTNAMIYSSRLRKTFDTPIFFGDVIDLDLHFNSIMIETKVAGGSSLTKTTIFNINKLHNGVISSNWISNTGLRTGVIKFSVVNNKLSISENNKLEVNLDSSVASATLTNNNPTNAWEWLGITAISFCNI